MPVTRSALKKLRQDKKRAFANRNKKEALKKKIRLAQKSPTDKNVKAVISALDRAVKVHILHKNKAARLKSRLSKIKKTSTRPLTKKGNSSRLKS